MFEPTEDELTRHLLALGVKQEVIAAHSFNTWRPFLAELDRFYAYGYGEQTKRSFLTTIHPELELRTPAEVLADKDGPERVKEVFLRMLANF